MSSFCFFHPFSDFGFSHFENFHFLDFDVGIISTFMDFEVRIFQVLFLSSSTFSASRVFRAFSRGSCALHFAIFVCRGLETGSVFKKSGHAEHCSRCHRVFVPFALNPEGSTNRPAFSPFLGGLDVECYCQGLGNGEGRSTGGPPAAACQPIKSRATELSVTQWKGVATQKLSPGNENEHHEQSRGTEEYRSK